MQNISYGTMQYAKIKDATAAIRNIQSASFNLQPANLQTCKMQTYSMQICKMQYVAST